MPFLHSINDVREAPVGAYLVYNLKGGIYYLSPRQYEPFIVTCIGQPKLPPLSFDLSSLQQHALIFDLDLKQKGPHYGQPAVAELTYEWIEGVFKNLFLQSIPHFTYIVCTREGQGGIHVHLPEFTVAHDDYVLLCQSLQTSLGIQLDTGEKYTLDILQNAMLPGTVKPEASAPYFPRRVVFVDKSKTLQLGIFDYQAKPQELEQVLKKFKSTKANNSSFFQTLLRCSSPNLFREELKHALMPLVFRFKPVYKLGYPTIIGSEPAHTVQTIDLARIAYRNGECVYIVKDTKKLDFEGRHLLMSHSYLKINAPQISDVVTNNHAIKQWSKRFLEFHGERAHKALENVPECLHPIHHLLCKEHPFLSQLSNPLRTLMEYNDGYFFLPVFYALCRHLEVSVTEVTEMVRLFVHERYHPLLDRLRHLDEREIAFLPSDVTLNTIHYCCDHMCKKPATMSDKLDDIVKNHRETLLSMTTQDQIIRVVRRLIDGHFPIKMLQLKNNLRKATKYIWNFLTESWQELLGTTEVHDHVLNLWSHVRCFLIDYGNAGGVGGPAEHVYERFSVQHVTAMINSDCSMERILVQMDVHKWFLRLKHGMLDLLTGHIGAIVPEFYMSDRRMGLDFTRERMIRLCDDSPLLESVYTTLVNPRFVLRFLKNVLVAPATATQYGTASELLREALPELDGAEDDDMPLIRSMLHFYTHLCVYMSFEQDMIQYLMDVMASTFIATNYERKFIVWKGVTKNGKSELFSMLQTVFGGYYVGIQSENLMPVSQGNTATPELASSLFSARIVTCEELGGGKLNENRVKQITGNSHVTFRNLYEQHGGGIPTAKVFANTNNYPDCRASRAFQDRTVAVPFDAHFDEPYEVPETVSEQARTNTYPKEPGVIQKSYKGCFLMLYYHFKRHVDRKDGYLHLRKEPPYVLEFTHDYLTFADVYNQFKMFMDVQVVPGTMTTLSQVKSAIRQYLKSIKNSGTANDTDLLERFEFEFKGYRRTPNRDELLFTSEYQSALTTGHPEDYTDEDPGLMNPAIRNQGGEWLQQPDAGGTRKREYEAAGGGVAVSKQLREGAVVYYENITIKNLKK